MLFMAYRIASFPMTLSYFHGHAPIVGLLKCDFLYSCEAISKMSTDIGLQRVARTVGDISASCRNLARIWETERRKHKDDSLLA